LNPYLPPGRLLSCLNNGSAIISELSFPPRIKYGAGSIKSGMTKCVKSFVRHDTGFLEPFSLTFYLGDNSPFSNLLNITSAVNSPDATTPEIPPPGDVQWPVRKRFGIGVVR
jgi:hypothetical protein